MVRTTKEQYVSRQINEAQKALAPLLHEYLCVSPHDAPGWLGDLREANAKLTRAFWAFMVRHE